MTRKHFKLIAENIARIENMEERKKMACHNAGLCKKSNPRFNHAKFYEACGIKMKEAQRMHGWAV